MSEHDPRADHARREHGEPGLPIVGIGASAGGLAACKRLLQHLPIDTGMGFVIVQHLSPSSPSMLAELLSHATAMPVVEVTDEPLVLPDHVYVIPPGRQMSIAGRRLGLRPRSVSPDRTYHVIDEFLVTLARDAGHLAIGVILSGNGSDGTVGLEEIKAEGGISFAQDASAEYGGMPGSAIEAGCADFVMDPAGIGRELARLARHIAETGGAPVAASVPLVADVGGEDAPALERLFELLRDDGDPDFTHYKRTTLDRRIRRRMELLALDTLDAYCDLLANDPSELTALRHDLLIGVTSFFRDPEDFEFLKREVLPLLTANRSRHEPLRMWCVGCSTGEEVYSLAAAYAEYCEESGTRVPLKIFATDVSTASINKARFGDYPASVVEGMSEERQRRLFVPSPSGTRRVTAAIREQCVFAPHDVISDPPFSHIDLIVCRNMLIYMDAPLQEHVLAALQFALSPGGVLWLGTSETPGVLHDEFRQLDGRHRMFVKRPQAAGRHANRRTWLGHPGGVLSTAFGLRRKLPHVSELVPSSIAEAHREADRLTLAKYAPPAVVVNANMDIVQFRGDGSLFFTHAPGQASLNLLKLAREELLVGLRNTIHRAQREESPVREEGLVFRAGDREYVVDLDVVPLRGGVSRPEHFLVSFERASAVSASRDRAADPDRSSPADAPDGDSKRLAHELTAMREYLQSVIEQQLDTNRELQATIEELQSANEELQSINEELETSKEEMQSANEEISTVNDELLTRNTELGRSNADFENLLGNVQICIVMLDQDLRIRRFTPGAKSLLNLIPADVGRPIGDISVSIDVPDLVSVVEQVRNTGRARELTVRARSGRWHALRLHPYVALDESIDGVVMVLLDIDAIRSAQDELRASEERLRLLIEGATNYAIMMLDLDGRVTSWNSGAEALLGYTAADIVGLHFSTFFTEENRRAGLPAAELGRAGDHLPRDIELRRRDGTRFWASGFINPLRDAEGHLRGYGKIVQDITERRKFEQQLQLQAAELEATDRARTEFLAMLAHELRNPLAALHNATTVIGLPDGPVELSDTTRKLMVRQIGNMSRMIDDLLDMSRLAQGKIELHPQVTDLRELLGDVIETHRPMLDERKQKLDSALPEGPLVLMGDPVRLEQVFGNLIHNASKFGHDGGRIRVEVVTGPTDDPEENGSVRMITVRVRDDGIGMDAELLPRVFGLFTQAENSIERHYGGLGIGLNLARRLIELHGGSIEAGSEGLGRGSTFTVRLPTEPNLEPRSAPGRREVGTRTATPRHVLVVDDNSDAAESLALLLRTAGHDVQVAFSSRAALALDPSRFDAAILDIGMPGMSGIELASEIRRLAADRRPALVALTGYGHADMQASVRAAGFDRHLVKPAEAHVILEFLDSIDAGELPRPS